ncbi:MAG: HAMP domain-containing sensor histidine kinase [Acidobacteria bacterium]|nr:HAMP domain-containing sensor histidine kinase [Acidobacteriota bacterium]
MKRLRLYFALFFILLAVPIVILLRHTYNNLEQESFFLYRRTAEGLMATVHQRLQEKLLVEEQRPYTHYRYIHVADRPLPQQEGLNLSPLASFPVQSEIPGILGYFQIDPDGSFHTPLLPDGVPDSEMVVPRREEREQMRDQLVTLLEGRTFFPSTGLRAQLDDLRLEESPASVEETFSNFRDNLESNVDVTLESEYARQASRESGLAVPSEQEEKKESVQRRLQKSSPMQAEVFDSQLKDAYSEELDKAKENASPQGADILPSRVAGEPEIRILRRGDEQLASPDADVPPEPEVVAEVDPFQSELIDRDWLVLYRNVWAQERRYIQGFATSLTEFLQAHLDPAFLNSALPETASYLVFYEGEILQPEAGDSTHQKPLLLHSSALPYPLSDFHLAITVGSLPQSPAHQLVNFLAVFLSLLFIGGLLGIYRLTTTQMELSQKKSDFVSAISHELKTPLTAIRMYGEVLMEGWVEEEKKERYYQHIHDESERLSRLIQNVLTLAELERNEWQINLQARHPVELITSITERLTNQVTRAGFEFSTITEGEAKSIQVDTDALTQILINLIDNAIKFSKDAETKKIVLTVSQVGMDCYIRVRDFGPGIPSRKLKSIFEKFYRIDNEMTRTTRGTGIGLALVKMLADAMGAHVDVSNRQPGTEFSIRFPTDPG